MRTKKKRNRKEIKICRILKFNRWKLPLVSVPRKIKLAISAGGILNHAITGRRSFVPVGNLDHDHHGNGFLFLTIMH